MNLGAEISCSAKCKCSTRWVRRTALHGCFERDAIVKPEGLVVELGAGCYYCRGRGCACVISNAVSRVAHLAAEPGGLAAAARLEAALPPRLTGSGNQQSVAARYEPLQGFHRYRYSAQLDVVRVSVDASR